MGFNSHGNEIAIKLRKTSDEYKRRACKTNKVFRQQRVEAHGFNCNVNNTIQLVTCISHVTICESSGKAHSSQEFEDSFYLQLKVL